MKLNKTVVLATYASDQFGRPDTFRDFRRSVEARIAARHDIQRRLMSLHARLRDASSLSQEVEQVAPDVALLDKRIGMITTPLEMVVGGIKTSYQTDALLINICAFARDIAQALGNDEKNAGRQDNPGLDFELLLSTCNLSMRMPIPFADVFELVYVIDWCCKNEFPNGTKTLEDATTRLQEYVEGEYIRHLRVYAKSLSEVDIDDAQSTVDLLLHIQANFSLDISTTSELLSRKIVDLCDQIGEYEISAQERIVQMCKDASRGIAEGVFSFDWEATDKALSIASKVISYRDAAAALDIWQNLVFLRAQRMASLASYLFIGHETDSAILNQDLRTFPALSRMILELQSGHKPEKDIDTLVSFLRTNGLTSFLHLAGRIDTNELFLDAVKAMHFLSPAGGDLEFLSRNDISMVRSLLPIDTENHILTKAVLNWAVPPALISAFTLSDTGFAWSTIRSIKEWINLGQWEGLDVKFCGTMSRAFDVAYPNHAPLLIGHPFHVYPAVKALYKNVPTEAEDLSQVLVELFGKDGGRINELLDISQMQRAAIRSIESMEELEAKSFLKTCYERSGFLVTSEFCEGLTRAKLGTRVGSKKQTRKVSDDLGLAALVNVCLEGGFFEVRDRLECSEDWNKVCEVVQEIYIRNYSGDLKARLGSTLRDAISSLKCPDFVKSMVARGVVYKVLQTVVNDHRIGKWQIAEELAFFREVPVDDLRSWYGSQTKETPELAKGKRNFEEFLRIQCHFDSVEKSNLLAHGRFSDKEHELFSKL